MCGIFGHIGKIDKDKVQYCTDKLKHRGPDYSGIYCDEKASFGHRRLSIIDLDSRSNQPMLYGKDDRYLIVFNGEIYNYLEIKKELEKDNFIFKTTSDTEVILASYIKWGVKCLNKFNGMFAFGIWDKVEEKLFLARDRFGKKPLFYAHIESSLVFASEMKAITPLLKQKTLNNEIINNPKKIFYYESTESCLIREIKRLKAGHYAVYKNKELKIERYWNTLDNLVEVPTDFQKQQEELRNIFLDSCKIRMRSDVQIGTALSGGLDSSIVFASIAQIGKDRKDWQNAFVASFPDSPIDESTYAKKMADHIGVNLNILDIKPEKYIGELEEQIYSFEDIYITPHIPFMALYKEMREAGIKVSIDGHGADEIFGGYSFDFLHVIYDNLFNINENRKIIETYIGTKIEDSDQFKESKNPNTLLVKETIKNVIKRLIGYKNKSSLDDHPKWKELSYFTQKLIISSHDTVLPTLLRNYDRYSMASGIEIRMPFMDHRVITYGLSLPWTSKIRNGYTKAILRDAFSDLLPKDIAYRKTKVGFNSPIVDWLQGPMKEYVSDTISSQDFLKTNMIKNPLEIRKRLENVMDKNNNDFIYASETWAQFFPYLWHKHFYERILRENI